MSPLPSLRELEGTVNQPGPVLFSFVLCDSPGISVEETKQVIRMTARMSGAFHFAAFLVRPDLRYRVKIDT